MKNLFEITEAIIFAAGTAISRDEIMEKLPPDVKRRELNDVIAELEKKYSGESGIILEIFDENVQFCSNTIYGEIVAEVLQPVKEKELSKILMEVLSIIAYKQPVTRTEIEDIRGVSPDYALNVLLKSDLIKTCGFKQSPGRPTLYGTTDEFLKKFQLRTLDELPDYGEVMRRLIEFGNFNVQTEGMYRDVDLADDFQPTSSQLQQDAELDGYFDSSAVPSFLANEKIATYESQAAADVDDSALEYTTKDADNKESDTNDSADKEESEYIEI
ncbi:MAG: SMC-Scp complex subunit ScpB [Clostridia bacterium]